MIAKNHKGPCKRIEMHFFEYDHWANTINVQEWFCKLGCCNCKYSVLKVMDKQNLSVYYYSIGDLRFHSGALKVLNYKLCKLGGSLFVFIVVLGQVPKWVGWDKWRDKYLSTLTLFQ